MTQRALLTIFTAIILVTAVSAQVPQRDTRSVTPTSVVPPAPTGTSTVSGVVVAEATDAPIGLAAVVLIGTRTGVLKVTTADREGQFAFTSLPADDYTIGASKLPYLGTVAGARRPARPGSPVVVGDGEHVDTVAIRMPMGAAVSGTLYDEYGAPATGVAVRILQRRMQNGERILLSTPAGPVTTDDRGQYRAHGLPPGEYLIVAGATGTHQPVAVRRLSDAEVDAVLSGGTGGSTEPENTSAAPVYYPGTTRANDAGSVHLAVGEDRQHLDFSLQRVRPVRIEGAVTTTDGSLLPAVTLRLTGASGSSPLSTAATVNLGPDGQFSIPNQIPNTYVLVARTTRADNPLTGLTTIEVTETDVVGVQVGLRPPLTLTGRVVATGTSRAPSLAGHQLRFEPTSAFLSGTAVPQVSPTSATGEFRITNLHPGRFTLAGTPYLGATGGALWGLESVRVDGTDVTDRFLDIHADAPPTEIVVTFTDQWQDISGRVSNTNDEGVSDYTMLVFPVDEQFWLYNSRRVVTAQPNDDGRYQLGGPGPALLPPGEYYLAAVTDVSRDEQYDPAFLQSLIPAALRITLAPGQRVTQHIRVQ